MQLGVIIFCLFYDMFRQHWAIIMCFAAKAVSTQ
jgi:hypothetical protein